MQNTNQAFDEQMAVALKLSVCIFFSEEDLNLQIHWGEMTWNDTEEY